MASTTQRLDFRVAKEDKELIERAAFLSGQSVTDFATSVLVRQARQIVEKHEQTVLSDRDRDIFLKMLDSDAKPNAALRKAAKTYMTSYTCICP